MPRYTLPRKTWQRIVFVLSIAALIVVRLNKSVPGQGSRQDSRAPRNGSETRGSSRESTPPPSTGKWQTLEGCLLVEDKGNDGDSFVLRHGDSEYTFRLYFVDCPEKYRHQWNGDRLAEQGRYFGGLSEEETIAVGEAARDFSLGLLRKGPVTVFTRWEPVYDSERRYAFVTADGRDLAAALVSRGLARIHTKGAKRPGGTSEREEQSRLHALERTAKNQRLGAWGAVNSAPPEVVPSRPSSPGRK